MPGRLEGKVALVTAASRGLGLACARALGQAGARVAICSSNRPRVQQSAADLTAELQTSVRGYVCDLRYSQEIESIFQLMASDFGSLPDILVINVPGPTAGSFEELSTPDFEEAHRQVFMPALHLLRLALPHMAGQGFGRVVLIASIAVKAPIPHLLLSNVYRTATLALFKTLARQYAHRSVTLNAVCPGYHDTDRLRELAKQKAAEKGTSVYQVLRTFAAQSPAGRIGSPQELAALVAFLASPEASYINGTAIQVDGGMYEGLL